MLNKAIEKIKAEIDSNKNNSYIQVVGEFLLQYLNENPDTAEKILQEDKTVLKSLNEMEKAAKGKKVGNCAVLTDQEGFEIVLKYFGIEGDVPINTFKPIETAKVPIIAQKSNIEFNIELDF